MTDKENKSMIDGIYEYMKISINQEYDRIKRDLLKDLELKLELQRNRLVNDVLNAIDIKSSESPMGAEFNITINKIIHLNNN